MATASKAQMWIGGGVAAAVVIAVAAWFLLISPEFSAADDAQAQLADAQTQNIVLQKRLDTLREQASHTDELQQQLDEARAGLPAQHDLDAFTRQLGDQADAAHLRLVSITPGSPTPVVSQTPSSSAVDDTDTNAPSDSASTDSATDSAAPTSQQVYTISVTVVATGPMEAQRQFLSAIEKDGPRRALVVSTSFAPADDTAAAADAAVTTGDDADGSAATDASGTGDPVASSTVTTPVSGNEWTMTAQLQIFVLPQAPSSDAAPTTAPGPTDNG